MSTVAAPQAASKAVAIGAYDRVFYSSMAIAMAFLVFAGFAPTFYLRALFDAPVTVAGATTLTPLAYVHGAVFTAWVLLFVVQTTLIANRNVRMHKRLGIAGAVLAAVMFVVGISTAIAAARRGAAPPGLEPLVFLAVPMFDMLLFPIFIVTALWQRRNKEAHKRLMLLAYISILAAAVARLPGLLVYGPFVFFGLTFIFLAIGIVYDIASRRRVHPVYIWGGLLLIVSVPGRLMISGTDAWRTLALFLTQ